MRAIRLFSPKCVRIVQPTSLRFQAIGGVVVVREEKGLSVKIIKLKVRLEAKVTS